MLEVYMAVRKLLAAAFAATALLTLPLPAAATDRLTDQEVKTLLEKIEQDRSTFEAALDEKLKGSTIKAARGEVKVNEFLDDLQDQVERARDRFNSEYSASSEVASLLDYTGRLQQWASAQPAGFQGSKEWGVFGTDLQRLAAAYNTMLPMPATGTARRFNDAELVTAAANVEKLIDPYRTAYDATLAGHTTLTPEMRKQAIGQVDMMKSQARALNAALANKQKGVPEADALLKQAFVVIETMAKLSLGQATTGAWNPLRAELAKVAWAYEVNNRSLPIT
jgi:hypothetical protein